MGEKALSKEKILNHLKRSSEYTKQFFRFFSDFMLVSQYLPCVFFLVLYIY